MNETIEEEKWTQLLDDFNKLTFKEKVNPTFLDIFKQQSRETLWTNILAFYFNPNKEHNLDDLILRSFFDALRETVVIENLKTIEVHPNFRTQKGKYIDLVVIADNFVIAIENKVYAPLYNPLEEYGNEIEKMAIKPDCKIFKVILSITHYNEVQDFKNLTYECLIKSIEKNLPDFKSKSKVKYLILLKDFLKHIKRTIKFNEMIEDKKVLNFFKSKYSEIKKLSSKFSEFNDEVRRKFVKVHEAIDLCKLDTNFKEKYGILACISKSGIQDDWGFPIFWIPVDNGFSKIRFEIYIEEDNLRIFSCVGSENMINKERIEQSDEPERSIEIDEDTKVAANMIINFVEDIIGCVFVD